MCSFWCSVSMRYLFFLALMRSVVTEEYVIERQVRLIRGSWIDQPDRFMLPTSLCSGDISANCSAMGGTRIENTCGCICDKKNHFSEFYQSTIGYYDNRWKCFENRKVRSHADCQTIINDRQDTIPLMTLPMRKPSIGHYIPGLNSASNCAINGGKYLRCDGKWQQLNITLVKSRFYVQMDYRVYLYYSITQPSTPTINGRVIKLDIGCTRPKTTQCALFKVKGQLKCPVISTNRLRSTWLSINTSTKTKEPTTFPLVTKQLNETRKMANNQGDNSGLIAGAVAGVIGLSLIVIAIVLMRRYRKKRYAVRKENDAAVENETYGLGIDTSMKFSPGQTSQDEVQYPYTSNINNGVRVGFQGNHRNVSGPRLDLECQHYDQDYAVPYKTGIQSQPGAGVSCPIYDSPEVHRRNGGRKYKNHPDRLHEPIYYVLEKLNTEISKAEEPPCYCVSGETFSEGQKNILLKEKVIHLDGNDSKEHRTVNDFEMTDRKDGIHDETIYNRVGEVIIE